MIYGIWMSMLGLMFAGVAAYFSYEVTAFVRENRAVFGRFKASMKNKLLLMLAVGLVVFFVANASVMFAISWNALVGGV